MIGKMVGRDQFDRTFVGEKSGDQRSHILEDSVQEISPVVDLWG
jgi:hypothetical protein